MSNMKIQFGNLPQSVQERVKETLCAFSKCSVYATSTGDMEVMTGACIHSGAYYEIVGEYHANEIYTAEERIVNYVKAFRGFPWYADEGLHYEGAMDWAAINSNWTNVSLVDGNLIFS